MRIETITRTLYQFEELSEQAQKKALESMFDINVDFEWWEFIYEELKSLGLKCNGFDIDRGCYCKLEFVNSANEIATKIVDEHGEECTTYKTAKSFLAEWAELVSKYSDGINKHVVTEENECEFDEKAVELEKGFLQSLSGDYLKILRDCYEDLTSDEAIKESIAANEYEFDETGKRA